MKNDILCQFSAAVAKLLLRHILFADSVENLRQAKCQIYNIGPWYERFYANWFSWARIVKDKICDADCFR